MQIFDLIDSIKAKNKNIDKKPIIKAYEFAEKVHSGIKRLSGSPFIFHPLQVAYITSNIYTDNEIIPAALLHDVIEDGNVKLFQIKNRFGRVVSYLVNGVTKSKKSKNHNKLFKFGKRDFRVFVIKIADRLHNMSTLKYLPREKQISKSVETIEVYAQISALLGLYKIKSELENLSLKYLHPKIYSNIENYIKNNREKLADNLNETVKKIKKILHNNEIQASLNGRLKHNFSIYQKMKMRSINDLSKINDISAIRVIVNTNNECYQTIPLIHSYFEPVPASYKDYIRFPKPNGYKSLHTVIVTGKGNIIEIQVRTAKMEREAEKGISAHWRYKKIQPDLF